MPKKSNKTLYKLTPEHEALLPAWRDKWIKSIMSTTPMSEEDKEQCRKAVIGLYKTSGLEPPKHIVFTSSPFVARVAGGLAAAIWYKKNNPNKRAATRDATRDATDAATWDATWDATEAATRAATWAATRAATGDATEAENVSLR